jgi:hypothetical protein
MSVHWMTKRTTVREKQIYKNLRVKSAPRADSLIQQVWVPTMCLSEGLDFTPVLSICKCDKIGMSFQHLRYFWAELRLESRYVFWTLVICTFHTVVWLLGVMYTVDPVSTRALEPQCWRSHRTAGSRKGAPFRMTKTTIIHKRMSVVFCKHFVSNIIIINNNIISY